MDWSIFIRRGWGDFFFLIQGLYTHAKEKVKIQIFGQDLNFRLRVRIGRVIRMAAKNGPEVFASIIRPAPLLKSNINIKQIKPKINNIKTNICNFNNINIGQTLSTLNIGQTLSLQQSWSRQTWSIQTGGAQHPLGGWFCNVGPPRGVIISVLHVLEGNAYMLLGHV